MQILCAQCQSPIELTHIGRDTEISCPACGSSFFLESESTVDWRPRADQMVGRFKLQMLVGQGTFGMVYKAHDTQLDRVVALKVPRTPQFSESPDHTRFLHEARSVARLRHPSILPIHEVGQHDHVTYLVTDFLVGITLADLLTTRRPPFREAAHIVATIAEALHYAHAQGVVHRDVKPSNIMLDEQGRPFLMDFGLARRDTGEVSITVDGQVLGTPAYMSP
jgi:serine/threonine protein kinase/DNA-directed RNA polymerase subunit RPC12/RpoP